MIQYNTLKLEGAFLIYDISVDTNTEGWEDVDLNHVRVDTSKTYNTDTPFDTLHPVNGECQGKISIAGASDELLILTPSISNLSPTTPCGKDVVEVATIYSKDVLLNKGLKYLKNLEDSCNISREFIDFILKKNAFDMAIATCNYYTAAKMWRLLTGTKSTILKGCGCNGN